MLAPIQVDGGGVYDLYDFGYGLPRCGCAEGKCTCARSGCQCGEDKCKCTKDHCACLEEPCGCSGAELLCVPAMAFFDSDDGGYTYGVTRSPGSAKDDPKPFVLQIGASKDAKIEATEASPLKGGVVVRNEPGSEYEMPKTGGAGTGTYIILGSAMALLSGLALAGRKKRG